MKRAIIIKGPSGVGKSSVSSLICKNNNYKHCDADEFKWLFSHKRSKERTQIGESICYIYTKELIKNKYNIIIEALPGNYIKKLIPLLKKNKYKIIRIVLQAPLKQCIKNNTLRKRKGYDEQVIREVYDRLSSNEGDKINVSNKSVQQIYNLIRKKYFQNNKKRS
jgi:predicted kinase|tara:strand:- start:650 stop:1144 length:495 start_codon:yes stop_codon:yes gene_type:complete